MTTIDNIPENIDDVNDVICPVAYKCNYNLIADCPHCVPHKINIKGLYCNNSCHHAHIRTESSACVSLEEATTRRLLGR